MSSPEYHEQPILQEGSSVPLLQHYNIIIMTLQTKLFLKNDLQLLRI